MSLQHIRKSAKALSHELLGVLNMNRDRFDPDVVQAFEGGIAELASLRRSGSEDELVAALDAGRAILARHTPPCRSPGMRELVETLVVAFGVAMAFRAFFFQPF